MNIVQYSTKGVPTSYSAPCAPSCVTAKTLEPERVSENIPINGIFSIHIVQKSITKIKQYKKK